MEIGHDHVHAGRSMRQPGQTGTHQIGGRTGALERFKSLSGDGCHEPSFRSPAPLPVLHPPWLASRKRRDPAIMRGLVIQAIGYRRGTIAACRCGVAIETRHSVRAPALAGRGRMHIIHIHSDQFLLNGILYVYALHRQAGTMSNDRPAPHQLGFRRSAAEIGSPSASNPPLGMGSAHPVSFDSRGAGDHGCKRGA